MNKHLQFRLYGDPALPTLIYLPGLHGDWTLVTSFRAAVAGKARFVEFTYPRTLTWSLEDYARAVEEALAVNGVTNGWLLAESFGSQIAWAMLEREQHRATGHSCQQDTGGTFRALGVILVGGFVKHPWPRGVRFMRLLGEMAPRALHRAVLQGYELYAGFRHRHAPETRSTIREFVERRTLPDRQAMWARLELIALNDPSSIARQTQLPVFYLAGLIDPLVPWPYVRWWLRRNCPGYRSGRTCWLADHNVLGTQPRQAAEIVLAWIEAGAGEATAAPSLMSASRR